MTTTRPKGQTCPHCGLTGQPPDSLKCDDCGKDYPIMNKLTMSCVANWAPRKIDAIEVFQRHRNGEKLKVIAKDFGIKSGRATQLYHLGVRMLAKVNHLETL